MSDAVDRRRRAAQAGHEGDAAGARQLLADSDASVRAAAVGALSRMGALTDTEARAALGDPDATVRRRACAAAVGLGGVDVRPLLDDDDASVVEAAAWALGEQGESAADAVDRLSTIGQEHPDPHCREAAVAALGAIGDRQGLAAVLRAAGRDRPAVRRRAVIALAAFDGPEVDAALQQALQDRDWQVRQAAEDLLAQ